MLANFKHLNFHRIQTQFHAYPLKKAILLTNLNDLSKNRAIWSLPSFRVKNSFKMKFLRPARSKTQKRSSESTILSQKQLVEQITKFSIDKRLLPSTYSEQMNSNMTKTGKFIKSGEKELIR